MPPPSQRASQPGRVHPMGEPTQWGPGARSGMDGPVGPWRGALGADWLFPLQELVTVHRWKSTQPPLMAWALFPACVSPL